MTAPTYRALAKQTGLKPMVTRRALRPKRADMGSLEFQLRGQCGFINLKYFGARETRAGVSAAPFGKRQVFAGTFLKGGLFPKRKTLPFEGTAFRPKGKEIGYDRSTRGLMFARNKTWGRPFERAPSGVRIPDEMVKGATAEVLRSKGSSLLAEKVNRHIRLVTKGVLS